MIGRSHRLSPGKGLLIAYSIGIACWAAVLVIVIGAAHDRASRGELPALAREVTR